MTRFLTVLGWFGFTALMAGTLFGSAGRWDLPQFWVYVGVMSALLLVAALVVEPGLIKERLRPGRGGRDYLTRLLVLPLFLAHLVIAGLDVGRFFWSVSVPVILQVVGFVGMAAAVGFAIWAIAVNRFFSSVVRIQAERGHHLITTGPYQYVRHPGYAAGLICSVCSSLALGSWASALPLLVWVPLVLRRTALEDRLLHGDLPGYAEYGRQVRHRLLPGLW
jgi:protein-S-isoprenylcysteine O-methyltransferase Ste14